ncbi:MAG TPA: LacI family DNA-binding transcriptional regulator [Acidimicrobiales bacterium]|nr:LacI family DNA-binding transcriptional regulator [Acidimicrobiales bacterium]
MTKPVTIKDVAAAAGVSTATVSRVLTGDTAISAARRAAVLSTARRLQYRPSAAARRLRTKSSSLLGVVVQSVGDGYVGEVVLGIQNRARDLGFQPLFFVSEGQARLEAEALEVFLSEQVRELISVSPTGRPHLLGQAVDSGLHVSVINWDIEVPARLFDDLEHGAAMRLPRFGSNVVEKSICQIKFDDVGAGMLATTHLLELGHRNLAYLRGPDVRSSLLRLVGFRRALEAADLWPQTVLTAESPVLQSRELAIAAYLRRQKPPIAIVAYDDLCAVATMRAANHAGWRVPEDLSVVGIDDIQFSAYTNPGLTSVAQPKQELGALAVDALLSNDGEAASTKMLDGRLIVRESTTAVASAVSQDRRPGGAPVTGRVGSRR